MKQELSRQISEEYLITGYKQIVLFQQEELAFIKLNEVCRAKIMPLLLKRVFTFGRSFKFRTRETKISGEVENIMQVMLTLVFLFSLFIAAILTST